LALTLSWIFSSLFTASKRFFHRLEIPPGCGFVSPDFNLLFYPCSPCSFYFISPLCLCFVLILFFVLYLYRLFILIVLRRISAFCQCIIISRFHQKDHYAAHFYTPYSLGIIFFLHKYIPILWKALCFWGLDLAFNSFM
jgi:hypothetical protein